MKQFVRLAVLAAIVLSGAAWAGNAAPLGLELGVATLMQVQKEVGAKSKLNERGPNKFTNGKMLSGSGAGLGIDGLSEIVFIFDQKDVLAGVLMTLPKSEGMNDLQNGFFKKTAKALAAKYKQVEKREPFVGDAYARYSQGNSMVELEAPHMGFSMSLRYVTNDLMAQFNKQSGDERAAKNQAQAAKF